MSKEVENYRPEEEFHYAKHEQYCELLKEHLQKKLTEKEDCLTMRWSNLAARTVRSLCGMTTILL